MILVTLEHPSIVKSSYKLDAYGNRALETRKSLAQPELDAFLSLEVAKIAPSITLGMHVRFSVDFCSDFATSPCEDTRAPIYVAYENPKSRYRSRNPLRLRL